MVHHMPTMRSRAGSRRRVSFRAVTAGEEKSQKKRTIAAWTLGIQATGRVRIWKTSPHSRERADWTLGTMLSPPRAGGSGSSYGFEGARGQPPVSRTRDRWGILQ